MRIVLLKLRMLIFSAAKQLKTRFEQGTLLCFNHQWLLSPKLGIEVGRKFPPLLGLSPPPKPWGYFFSLPPRPSTLFPSPFSLYFLFLCFISLSLPVLSLSVWVGNVE